MLLGIFSELPAEGEFNHNTRKMQKETRNERDREGGAERERGVFQRRDEKKRKIGVRKKVFKSCVYFVHHFHSIGLK